MPECIESYKLHSKHIDVEDWTQLIHVVVGTAEPEKVGKNPW